MYRQGDHQDLAAQIKALIANPSRTRAIAEAAWNLSREYTYDGRAARLLQLMDAAYNLRRVEQVAYG
jgi:spore maturation protein CgeB